MNHHNFGLPSLNTWAYFRCLHLKLYSIKYTNKCVQIKNIPSSNVLQKSFPMQSAKLLRKFVLPRQTKLLKVKEKNRLHNLHSGIPHRFLKNKISNIPFIYKQKTNKQFYKVSFFVQCMKKQLITLQNFNIPTCFSQFLCFYSLKF